VATNYTVSLGNGSLTVTGAVLTATANNASRAYGATNPVFTVSYNGFVNGDGTMSSPCTGADDQRGDEQPGGCLHDYQHDGELGGDELHGQPGQREPDGDGCGIDGDGNNASRAYGATNPVFTVSYNGL